LIEQEKLIVEEGTFSLGLKNNHIFEPEYSTDFNSAPYSINGISFKFL